MKIVILTLVLLICTPASAGLLMQEIPGNDSAPFVSFLLERDVYEVGRFEGPLFLDSLNPLITDNSFDYFAVKAGPAFNLYAVDFPSTFWVTPFGKDLSHITLYKSVPEPSGLLLMGLGMLVIFRRFS